jgi:hypothetical protein
MTMPTTTTARITQSTVPMTAPCQFCALEASEDAAVHSITRAVP